MIPEEKYYIKIGRAGELKKSKERIIYRLLEMLPGFLIWLTFAAMLFFSWQRPVWAAVFIIAFSLYFFLKTIHFTIHLTAAYKKMRENIETDWREKLDKISKIPSQIKAKSWKEIYHLVVLPMYKEEYEIVKNTMDAILNSDYQKERIIVVLGIEERAGQSARTTAERIQREYGKFFFRFLITLHPAKLPGEISGKGSNETWAGREVKNKIIDVEKIPYQNIIVSCFDIDTRVYPKYFLCLTYYYLVAKNPLRASFQPIPLYLNNLWDVPFFSRLVSSMNVFWQMMQQQRPEKEITYSSHAMGFFPLAEMDFWQTNVVSEDAGIFWKAFLFYDGDYKVVPLHYPVTMDAVSSRNFLKTALNQYRQQRRWAWGSEGIPYMLFGCLKNKNISLKKKLSYSFLIIEGFWAWATNAILLFCLGWLPLIFNEENFSFSSSLLAHNLPYITRNLMTLAMAGLFACIVINTLLITRLEKLSWRQKIFLTAQWLFFPFGLIIFGSFPAIDAQTRLMLAKYMGFWTTPKLRKT